MNTILISDIIVPPERQRTSTDPKKLEDLSRSIEGQGLFHAIILADKDILIAGATRLKAITEIYKDASKRIFYNGEEVPLGEVPFTRTHKTDSASLFRIELEENLRRENLSPIDEAVALAGLHELLQANAPEIIPDSGIRAPVTLKETAIELGKITGTPKTNDAQRIADSIMVDKFKDHPDVKRAKTLPEAARLARKAAERAFREALGGLDAGTSIESKHRLFVGDCAVELAKVEDGTVDIIIADPPYGVGADSFGEQSKVGHEYKDDELAFVSVLEAIVSNASRVCKPDAAMFIFLDIAHFEETKFNIENNSFNLPSLDETWYIWPTPLIWHKPNRGHAPQLNFGPSRRYEAILYAIRGSREVRKVGSDVLSFNVPDDRAHGAGKPVELYQELLSWIAYPGDTVLDPCAGSGTVISAADKLDLSAIAIERDEGHATMIREKMK